VPLIYKQQGFQDVQACAKVNQNDQMKKELAFDSEEKWIMQLKEFRCVEWIELHVEVVPLYYCNLFY
jgi:hypothetical protein